MMSATNLVPAVKNQIENFPRTIIGNIVTIVALGLGPLFLILLLS